MKAGVMVDETVDMLVVEWDKKKVSKMAVMKD